MNRLEARDQGADGRNQSSVIERADLQALFDALKRRGYALVGPRVEEGSVVYAELDSVDDLPAGWTDEQDGASYRLARRNDAALFGYTVGPHSWKKYLLPPSQRLWRAVKGDDGFEVIPEEPSGERRAFIGVRACELKALAIQDRVLIQGEHADPHYASGRRGVFIVALNCGKAGGTCFCVSMDSGPRCDSGFDLALTEVIAGGAHHFVAETGSEAGVEVLGDIPHRPATARDTRTAGEIVRRTAAQMGRTMETEGIKELLYANYDHSRWENVADRCLTCGNCTMVCPTCFCTSVEEVTDLTGNQAERWRHWDSCFTLDFSYIHGGSVRASAKSRYRQWMTHKLATWIDQFGSSGCVGCGRCITWCPVAIDITEEVAAIRADQPPAVTRRSR